MMSSADDSDPYISFQSEVSSLLETTRLSFSSYLRIRSLVPSTSPELLSARSELEQNLSTLSDDLTDLTAAVSAVESDPYKYGLDVADVSKRRIFVQEVAGEVEDMREELSKPASEIPTVANAGAEDDGGNSGGDAVEQWERQQQEMIMQQQDVQLDGVYRTTRNLRAQADAMGQELEEQGEMLGALGTDVERAEGKMERGVKELRVFIGRNEDRWSNWCIGLLIMVLCVLLFLLIVI